MAVAIEPGIPNAGSPQICLLNRYKSISSLASQIDTYIKNSPSNEGLFQPNPILLRKRLKDICSKALLSIDFSIAQLDKIEDMLWNQGFYRVIQKCRNSQAIHRDTPLQNAYRTHLTAGIGFYTSLLAQMTDTHNLASAHFLDWNRQLQPVSSNSPTDKSYEQYVYKILIHLGDLSRYQHVFTHNFDLTKRFYYQAIILNPSLGHAFNQLGGMYSGVNFNLDSVYFYLRSLACTEPMRYLSEANLKTIYDKNRALLEEINSIPISMNASQNKQNERLLRRFIVNFIRLQEIFSPSQHADQNSEYDMEFTCSRVLKDFEEFLRTDEFVGSNSNSFGDPSFFVPIVGGEPLFKISLISILTSHILRAHGSTHTPSATSFAISIFSIVLQNCYARVRKMLISLLDRSSLDNLPNFQNLKLNALQILSQDFKHILNDSDNEVGNGNSLGKSKSPIKQRKIEDNITRTSLDTSVVTKIEVKSSPNATGEQLDNELSLTKKQTSLRAIAPIVPCSDSDSEGEHQHQQEAADNVTLVKRGRGAVRASRESNGDLSEGNVSDSILSSRSNSSSSSGFEILGTDYSSEDDNAQVAGNEEEKCEKPREIDNFETPDTNPEILKESKSLDLIALNNDTNNHIKSIELTPNSQEPCDLSFTLRDSTPLYPQLLDKPFDQESVLSTPQNNEINQPVVDKTCKAKPKILLAAKFSLEDELDAPHPAPPVPPAATSPAETDTSVYISDTLTQLCRTLQGDDTLCVVRAFAIWLNNHPVVLATCAQKNAMLWSHLATLLNFLPSTREFTQHGVFPQHKEVSLLHDWSQAHPLYEDKLLYGLLEDDGVMSLQNIFRRTTPEEEQSLTRLIYLHRFGLLMAENKMAPTFTFDKATNSFIGPAQKEVLDAKIAEETRLIEQMQARERQGGLMKALAHQRLRGQVDMLKCQQQNLKESVLPFVLIPDALSLCNQLNTLKRLIHSNKFIVVIANVTLRILDEMKGQKQNYHARQALRFIEHEFENNAQCVRPQIHTPPSHLTGGRGKRRQTYNPTVSSIKELFEVGMKHSRLEESASRDAICLLFDDTIIQNFLSPSRRTYNQFAQVIEAAEQMGVTWRRVQDLFYKWMSQKNE